MSARGVREEKEAPLERGCVVCRRMLGGDVV